jgi:hypothetical protein
VVIFSGYMATIYVYIAYGDGRKGPAFRLCEFLVLDVWIRHDTSLLWGFSVCI